MTSPLHFTRFVRLDERAGSMSGEMFTASDIFMGAFSILLSSSSLPPCDGLGWALLLPALERENVTDGARMLPSEEADGRLLLPKSERLAEEDTDEIPLSLRPLRLLSELPIPLPRERRLCRLLAPLAALSRTSWAPQRR